MPDNYTLDGENYSQEDVLEAAEAKGLTIDAYISEYYPDDPAGNQIDSSTETQTTESGDMEFGSDDGSLEQPEDGKDVVKNLINIDNNTTYEKDTDLKQSILERYFEAPDVDLSKIEGAKTIDSPMGQGVDWSTIKFEDATTASEDQLKEYFGEEKYNLYKKYQETGDLNIEDIPDSILPAFEEIQNEETKKRSRFLKEEQVRNNKGLIDRSFNEAIGIDEDARGLYSTDFIEEYSEIEKEAETYLEEAKGKLVPSIDEFGQPTMRHEGLTEGEKVKRKKELAGKAAKKQNQYLQSVSSVLGEDLNKYDEYLQGVGIKTNEDLEKYLGNQEIDIETRREVLNKNNELNKRIKDFQTQSIKFGDKMGALEALDKSYSWGYRAALSMEKAILGDIGQLVLGVGAMTADKLAPESRAAEYLRNNYVAHIDYAESVQQKQEANLPTTIKFADVGIENAGTFIGQQLGNNIFSIGTALTYAGVVKNITSKPIKKYAKRALQATFFKVEGGSKLSEMEIAQKNSAKNLNYINGLLEDENLTPDRRLQLEEEKEKSSRALNYTQSQRAFTALTYGGIATVAETLGTMRWIDDIAAMRKLTGNLSMKSILRGTGNFIIKSPGTEIVEETATQIGHNLMDNLILKENKSLIEGVDPDFFASTFITALAIGGPAIAPGVRNAFRNSVQTKEETQKFRDLATEFIENQYILKEGTNLSKGGINKKQADFIKARQFEILNKVGQTDINAFNKISDLDANQITNLFDISRKQGALYNKNFELGTTGLDDAAIKRDKDRLNKEYNDLQSEKEAILNEPAKKRNQKLKETAKEEGLEESDAMKQSFNYGKAAYYDNLVKGLGKKVIKFDGENALADLEKYLDDNNVDANTKAQMIKGFNEGGHGTFNGNDILTFEKNRRITMMAGTDIQKADAIQVAVHELQHQYDIEKGLVKDSKIVASHRPLVTALQDHVKELFNTNQISKDIYNQFKKRVDQYREKVNKNKVIDQTELLTLLGTMKRAGMLKDEKTSLLYEVKSLINSVRAKFLKENATLLDINTTSDVLRYIDTFNKTVDQGKAIAQLPPEEEVVSKESKGIEQKTPEQLVKIIQRGRNPKQVKAAEDALAPQFELLALSEKALNYDTRKGDIAREDVVAEAMTYLPGIIERFDPTTSKFSTFVIANMRPKQQVIYEKVKPLTYGETISTDAKEAREIADTTETTDKGPDTRRKKTNVLKIGKVEKKADAIKKIVKVKKGDTFKEVSDNNTGKVAEEIFDVPANKITDPKKNLTYAKKIKDGIPEPSEAGNIQSFYSDKQTVEQLVKILPLENVTSSDADINEIGENIDVDREVLGRGLGLTNRMLNYFYNKTNRRSQGLTSQPFIWELKPEFKKPTSELIDQLQEDLGITPRGELNNYNRNIGQLLKGIAKFQAQQTSLSTAQRILTEQKAPKKQIVSVTAAQSSKVAFSKGVENIVAIRSLFELEQKGIDKLLKNYGIKNTFNLKTEEGINEFVQAVKTQLLPLLPKDFWFGKPDSKGNFGTVFTGSSKVLGTTDAAKKLYKEYYEPAIKNLANDPSVKFGDPIKGVKDYSVSAYSTIFKDAKTIKANKKNGKIKEWNKKVSLIHEAMWSRFNKAIAKDKNNATVIGNYMKMVGSDSKHWHKKGAQFVGHSKKITGTRFEYEHAMPATAAYLYLMDAALSDSNFNASYSAVIDNYKLIALDKAMDKKLTSVGLQRRMPEGWDLMRDKWYDRYFNDLVNNVDGGIDPSSIIGLDGKTFGEMFNIKKPITKENLNKTKKLNKAIVQGRKTIKESKGITVLDFDDTLATTKSLVRYTRPDGTTGTLNAEEYASTYENLLDQRYVFDFSEFNKVVKGKLAPLFQKALKLQGKFGPENMFVLTARPMEAQKAIFDFLKANGLNIPIKNITGLGNSTAEAKALWMAEKVGEGYNDFYFADDALQNVQAVDNMLEQFDVKRKVQQAKIKFSKGMDTDFNNILENVTGIESKKRFSAVKARKRGEKKGRFRFFIPPSHEDFVGLLYNFIGKGKEGNAHRDFFEKALVKPLNRAYRELNAAKQSIANDYKSLNKEFKDVKKKLTKKTPDGDFTYQDAVRVYLWDKHGHKVPGLSPTDQQKLVDLVMGDAELQTYAETLNVISKQEKYVAPNESWEAGDIRTDLDDATGRIGRGEFFTEFFENVDVIFSQENLNKIEAAYGADVVSALKDILYRTKTGRNRPSGQNKLVNQFLNYLNGSVASTMFFNIRSAVLQQMSIVNFINFADNNILAAAKAFANQKQYWTDWATIFNSDFMKQRRAGIKTDVNGAELAASVKNATNPVQAAIKKLLELGFLPTQIGDNIAIATGGSTFYRNRINTYLKQGMAQKEAESKAWTDFQILAEATQQSARPDMVSQQQASPLGKVILAFQNVTSQFNRLGKKAFLDIKNRRITPGNPTQLQSDMSNLSRIAYYFAIQNLIFYSLQSALFMAMFDDDEEDERWLKKKERMINGSLDSVLRGTGVWGATIATLKNMAIKWHEQRDKDYNADESSVLLEMLNVSPPLGIKARKLVNAEKTLNYNKKTIEEMETFNIDNPQWSAYTNYIESTTNVPLNRLYNKTMNVRESLNSQHDALERVLMFSGWSKWNLGIEDIKKSKKKEKFGTKKFKTKTFKRKEFSR